jgi:hypothetical protein
VKQQSSFESDRRSAGELLAPDPQTSPSPEHLDSLVSDWLDECENELVHPARVRERLQRHGWAPSHAQSIADDYRKRFNEHLLGYSALLVTTGVAALALGSIGHLLTNAINGPADRYQLGIWLSVLICALPFAVWAHSWAARVDRDDPVAVWSRPRHDLALVLVWAAAVVGSIRLMVYATEMAGALVRAPWANGFSVLAGVINVGITFAIALPVGLWAYGFMHRFDWEDPSARPGQRQRRPSRLGQATKGSAARRVTEDTPIGAGAGDAVHC